MRRILYYADDCCNVCNINHFITIHITFYYGVSHVYHPAVINIDGCAIVAVNSEYKVMGCGWNFYYLIKCLPDINIVREIGQSITSATNDVVLVIPIKRFQLVC